MSAEKKKQMGVLGLIVALVVVLFGGVLFVGAASGWFDNTKVVLDAEYICKETCDEELMDLDVAGYEGMTTAKKTSVIFVDQNGCTTADRLRGFIMDYAREKGIKVNKIMFEQVKETSLHDNVKYYPSVVILNKGNVIGWLKADSDEDAEAYNNYDAFKAWMGKYLE